MYAHKHETGIKSNADEHSTMMLQLVVEFEKVPSFTRLCRFILRLITQPSVPPYLSLREERWTRRSMWMQ